MPSKTAGRIAKSQRLKKAPGQQHQKNHRWESFSSKIAQLHSLDPLHKVRRHDLEGEAASDLSATTSYFRNGLERWTDLNLSRVFTAFRRTVSPLCDSLAQILYYEERIMDALEKAIHDVQDQDDGRESLEPLLDLLTAFAHDLGSRFVTRGFDARAFALLVGVARHNSSAGISRSHHQQNHELDVAVIEWTFACLAFLFKYLSRLLVPDLRPTFDILVPLLGRPDFLTAPAAAATTTSTPSSTSPSIPPRSLPRVPGHIARFTAEALSFLVRMTANPSRRDSAMPKIINHIRDDLLQAIEEAAKKKKLGDRKHNNVQLYTQGIMTLFAESTKGPSNTLRLSSAELLTGMLHAIPENELDPEQAALGTPWSDVCCGVLTSIVHHADCDALKPVVEAILTDAAAASKKVVTAAKSKKSAAVNGPWRLSIYVRLIGVLTGVRGGVKISEWAALVPALADTFEAMASAPESQWPPSTSSIKDSASPVWRQIITSIAIVWNNAPPHDLRPHLASLTKSLSREPLSRWFVPFCAYAAELNPGKFHSTLHTPFQTFVSTNWAHDGNEDVLCAVLANMVEAGAFPADRERLKIPQSWQDSIVRKFEQLEATPFPERGVYGKDPTTWRDHCLPKYAALLGVLDTTIVHPSTPARIAELLLRKLKLALRPTSPQLANNDETVFIVTQGFRAYLRMTKASAGKPDPGLRPLLRAAAPRFARRTGFLEALLQYEQQVPEQPTLKDTKKQAEGEKDSAEEDEDEDPFVKVLVANLSAPSHPLRLVSLKILERIGDSDLKTDLATFPDHATALGIMLQTEDIGFAPHNVRNIAAHLRKLAQVYAHVSPGSWIQAAIPAFLYGMLSVPLAPVWEDAVKAMKQVQETNKAGEEAIANLAFDWLEVASSSLRTGVTGEADIDSSAHNNHGTRKGNGPHLPPTDFECFKYNNLVEAALQTESVVADPSAAMLQAFQVKQLAVPAYAGYERGKALKVLAAMPAVAEKRSRKLVPHLLSWTEDQGPRAEATDEEEVEGADKDEEESIMEEDEKMNDVDDAEDADADEAEAGADIVGDDADVRDSEHGSWSFRDKKALVVVFSLFTNSQVLYQSDKVYEALLKLLSNGDIEIQRLALKAIFAWRQASVIKYREQLESLLEESKFKNELTLLMQSDDENSANGIQPEHREDLMPVLLRLLYGRTISKKGAASGRQGLHATRLFVIRHLDTAGMGGFLQVALGNLQGVRVVEGEGSSAKIRNSIFPSTAGSALDSTDDALLTARKQVGVLNMLEPIITELGVNVTPFLDSLVNATLYCLICASRGLQNSAPYTAEQLEEADAEEDAEVTGSANTSLLRTAKTAALRCLCALFRNAPDYDWTTYRDAIVAEIISPVIERLPQETTQGVSWTWKLLHTWAQLPQCALFLAVDARVLPKILESLATKAKDAVKIHALSIVNSLVQLSATQEAVLDNLLMPNMDVALQRLSVVLRSTADGSTTGGSEISRGLLEACVDTVVALAPLVRATTHVRSLVDIATWLLNQPSRRVNPRVKGSLLLLLERFIRLDSETGNGEEEDKALQEKVFTTISSLFSFFKDRENRQTLCRVLQVFAAAQNGEGDAVAVYRRQLQTVADLCFDLNSYAESQLDEPDYDRRLAAFGKIARPLDDAAPFTTQQWLPLLHNLLFYVRVDEEYGILCSNAADGLCKFFTDTADPATQQPKKEADTSGLSELLTKLVLPAIYSGARDSSETVRREIARAFGSLVATLRAWPPVADLAPLVPLKAAEREQENGDDEAEVADMEDAGNVDEEKQQDRAFFANILSPSTAKQIQAMQVLEGMNAKQPLSSKNVSQFFIPFLEHFIFGREDGVDDRGLGAQATNTIAMLAYSLEWNQYRALLRRFLSFIESKPELQKQVVRLLDKVVDAVAESAGLEDGDATMSEPSADDKPSSKPKYRLAATLPDTQKLSDEVLNNLTPSLIDHLHDKDEETVSSRVPAAIILVKLLNLLPTEARDQRLAGVLTDVCHILRSKNWDSREMARETLSRISTILGASCFGFVLKELRGALTRGYQLHVLSYTVHTLLLAVIPHFAPGDFDYCVETLMTVVMDDVFGAAGEEKDADEYVSKMKEVKKSKSQDSVELIAKNVSVSQLGVLVQPLHMLMLERITKKTAVKIDTLLARIAAGLAQNPSVSESRDTLVFCYEIIQDVYRSRQPAAKDHKIDPRIKKFLFQKTERNNAGQRKTGAFTYKLIQFALDVLRAVLRKFDALRTPENVAGFIPVLGDAVLVGEEEVKIAAYKLLVVLVKVPFPDMTAFSGLYQVCTKEAIKTISTATTTTGDLAQSALKFVSVVLRSRHDDVPVRSVSVDALLAKVKDDLTNPLYRHVTFNFVRAVLDRKIESAVVYDTLDYIGTVMITNDDQDTRDLARRAFFQFLREYPQKRKRWERQLEFIVANFKYDREGGRLSAMEVVYMLLVQATSGLSTPAAAASDPFVQDIIGASFLPMVMVLANDESAKCRRVAGAQLTAMLSMAKRDYVNEFLKMFRTWLQADARGDLGSLKMGLELFGVYFASFNEEEEGRGDIPVTSLPSPALSTTQVQDIQAVIGRITALLGSDKIRRSAVHSKLVSTALETAQTMLVKFPVLALDKELSQELWRGIEQCLWHTAHPVRMAAMRLVGLYLADFARATQDGVTEAGTLFTGSYGMKLDDETVSRLVRGCLSVLAARSGDVDPVEAEEAAKMLVRLGQYLHPEPEEDGEEGVESDAGDDTDEDEAEEDVDDEGEVVSDDAADESDGEEAEMPRSSKPMDRRYVLLRLARVVRRETPPKVASLVPKAAAMAVLEAFCSVRGRKSSHPAGFATLSSVAARAILRPLRNLTDTSIPAPFSADPQFAPRYDELKLRAQVLMDALQTRLGTAEYTRQLLAVSAATRDRRQQRATKRKIEAVAQPEKYGRDKRKKLGQKKERRKARGLEHRGARWGY
ncbi:U3 snoRNP protein [Sporothrix epigloea]|uniref:U3 snoRNP protein n=1 Tax=Sporothrix epigloea TaxID=1892477 RepID=A0ABP0E2L8_9PEZI